MIEQNEILWSGSGVFDGRECSLQIRSVTSSNLRDAINIAATGFPGEINEVVKSFSSSLNPDPSKWTFSGANGVKDSSLQYILLYKDGYPVGVTGIYALKNHPEDAWMGWTALDPQVRESGLVKYLTNWFEFAARAGGYGTVRAWSVVNSLRFGGMHIFLEREGYTKEIFEGDIHGAGKYGVFSKSLTSSSTKPCPPDVIMVGGDDTPLPDTKELSDLLRLFRDLAAQRKMSAANVKAFREKHGSTERFSEGRIVDLTDRIKNGDPLNPDPLVKSFYDLNKLFFPVEDERENPAGFMMLVQTGSLSGYPPNERRIIVVLDENKEKVIVAVAFGVAATPESICNTTGVHGCVGLTYLMVDEQYRGNGFGKYIATEVVPQKAKEFLTNVLSVSTPNIIYGVEVNEVTKLTFRKALTDMDGAKTLPYARERFWNKCGFKKLDFDGYTQLKLRQELRPFHALRYLIAGWDQGSIPSVLASYVIEAHGILCPNKQMGLDEDDRRIIKDMRQEPRNTRKVKMLPPVKPTQDTVLLAAMVQASSQKPSPEDNLVGDILREYNDKILELMPELNSL